ncbi:MULTISPECIES: Y-family DNA polymerase [Pseudomonas]|uniref:DNA polymerase V n=1 Tax=Pseudomonas lutea TaxID=243924 RepID=A0A9X8MG45_9PSED|nr:MULTISPECIES: Y-family DNA polymerase [Pseudomonas]SER20882.1 DNA polymerase V [Pseudomonas lutea]
MSDETIFALIDCNSFYASCERVFRPDLKHTPIVVLSNNDGCVIARCSMAKKLGIKMGAPYFQIRDDLQRLGIRAFSSNYALYGDLSARVMTCIEQLVPRLEVYSIDEAWADLTGIPGSPEAMGRVIKEQVFKCTGIPVGVGIATTKTLAKLANHAAKRWYKSTGGVLDLRDPDRRNRALQHIDVGDVWGVGRRLEEKLKLLGIEKAWDLAQYDAWSIRKMFSVVLEKTVRELRGISCIDLEEVAPPKQMICTSRMFGQRQYTFSALAESVASYTARAAEKLRAQQSLCQVMRVGIQTGMHGPPEGRYSNGVILNLPYPTDDTRVLVQYALHGLKHIYREGYGYAKSEILLMDLKQRGEYSMDLFQPEQSAGADRLMSTMDSINRKFGKGMLRPARITAQPGWAMRRELMSQSYTTRLDQLWTVRS